MHYLTPKDLAQRYQISERQVTHLARIGYLPGFKIGKLWRFKEEDLQEWEGVGVLVSMENTKDSSDCTKKNRTHSLRRILGNFLSENLPNNTKLGAWS